MYRMSRRGLGARPDEGGRHRPGPGRCRVPRVPGALHRVACPTGDGTGRHGDARDEGSGPGFSFSKAGYFGGPGLARFLPRRHVGTFISLNRWPARDGRAHDGRVRRRQLGVDLPSEGRVPREEG